ncbi:hypothetical protein [Brevibacterium sp. ZH18]|uniref:hypothetical protein n=1 Tax=Brevibacterium sp. ZH18 TaxID=2927784 RepID=UPI001F611505|nr:hypothetical protein [Brevibacterium sp. ZH18]MCI4012342.1 hypothetical protein [Brevibacterium sp. ZH18]
MTTYNEAITKAGRTLAEGYHQMLNVGTPREAAERAYTPGGPSVDELEVLITKRRAELTERQAAA